MYRLVKDYIYFLLTMLYGFYKHSLGFVIF